MAGLGRPGSRPGIFPQGTQGSPAWEPAWAGHPQSRPAWAGQGAGHPPEPPGLEPGLGRPGGRPASFDAF